MLSCKEMLGKRIKELRKASGLTQEKLSELINLEPNHISKIEAGIHFPQPEKLESLARVFDVQIKDLFDYEHKLPEQILKSKIANWIDDAQTSEIEYIYKTIQNLKEYKKTIKNKFLGV